MKKSRIAFRYAKALFDLSVEREYTEDVYQDMLLVHKVLRENKDLTLLLQNPVVRTDKKIAIINAIFEKHLQKITILFFDIITKAGRESYIQLIAEQYIKLYKEYKGIITVTVNTVAPIDDQIRQKLISLLEKQTKAKIELIEELDDDLIGGFVMRYEDLEYDASLKKQIQNLRKEFETNLYIKGF